MSAKPWFAWYPADYRSKTSHLSFLEDCAYRRLLDAYFIRGGPIEFDRGCLFRITGAMSVEEQAAIEKMLEQFFYIKDNKIHNIRADEELEKQAKIRAQLSNAGKRGAAIAGRGRPMQSDRPSVRQYSQPQSQKTNTLALNRKFEDFWKTYPRKKSKATALRAWSKLNPQNGMFEQIMTALEQSKVSEDWSRNNGQFIPYPATWLNAAGWLDEQQEPESRMGKFVI